MATDLRTDRIELGLTGPDWEPDVSNRYYASREVGPNQHKNAFGPTYETALAELQGSKVTYWVMYSDTVPLQAGGERTSTSAHYGTSDLASAKRAVTELRDYASQGKHLNRCLGCINAAWIEVETRTHMEY